MRQEQHSTELIIFVFVLGLLAVVTSRIAGDRDSLSDKSWASTNVPETSFFLLSDEWLAEPGFGPGKGDTSKPRLVVFNQFEIKPCFETAPSCVLRAVPGIGKKLASAMTEFREGRGRVGSANELLSIPGIGPERVASLERVFTFGPCDNPPDPRVIDL